MLETTPGFPYSGCIADLLSVEADMRLRFDISPLFVCPLAEHDRIYRRQMIQSVLNPNEAMFSLACFPRLGGLGTFTEPHFEIPAASQDHGSLFIPKEVVGLHPRHQ